MRDGACGLDPRRAIVPCPYGRGRGSEAVSLWWLLQGGAATPPLFLPAALAAASPFLLVCCQRIDDGAFEPWIFAAGPLLLAQCPERLRNEVDSRTGEVCRANERTRRCPRRNVFRYTALPAFEHHQLGIDVLAGKLRNSLIVCRNLDLPPKLRPRRPYADVAEVAPDVGVGRAAKIDETC